MDPKCRETEADKARGKPQYADRILEGIFAYIAQRDGYIMAEHYKDY